ncbi:DUF4145 domain-containing protein [Comamonas sp.]|uniref:DUF4145 domain-containing protein n=1 Tax=Comamonas sp. TaxID=34028 RepID=UPI00289821E5|nr:DUF4145 domain-containing protein [Comamonas sp.]
MICTNCSKNFFPQPKKLASFFKQKNSINGEVVQFATQQCPSCNDILIIRIDGHGVSNPGGDPSLIQVTSEKIIYPEKKEETKIPDEVPIAYAQELQEAKQAINYSLKASAALSRRLLQKVLQQELGIKKRNLNEEIDEFINSPDSPSYLSDAIDAIRQIGNFAAHPIKNTNSGEIIDVEDGEAEWLVEVLESLYDFVFIQPKKLEVRREKLNKKLEELGKPKLKIKK